MKITAHEPLKVWAAYAFAIGLIALAIGYVSAEITPAFLSFGAALLLLPWAMEGFRLRRADFHPVALFFILGWTWFFINGTNGFDREIWMDKSIRKLPLLLIPVGLVTGHRHLMPGVIKIFLIVFIAMVSMVAIGSSLHYLQNMEEINEQISRSKSIPIWPIGFGINHIYFSVLQSLCVLLCLIWFKTNNKIERKWQFLLISAAAINFLSLHLLTTRTGLFALYVGLGVWLLSLIFFNRNKYAALMLVVLIVFPVFAYLAMPGLRNRVNNSMNDLSQVQRQDDINYQSFAMRVEAWKTSLKLIALHPVAGVGSGDVERRMKHRYIDDDTVLKPQNRVLPHNQFLETGVANGLIGMLLLLGVFISGWAFGIKNQNAGIIAVFTLFFVSLQVESLLERQIGLNLIPLFTCLMIRPGLFSPSE